MPNMYLSHFILITNRWDAVDKASDWFEIENDPKQSTDGGKRYV